MLTAGSKGQEVLDGGANGHSVFTGRLIELLEKAGDFITANEIQSIIRDKVNSDAHSRNLTQTPSFGILKGLGDFVFIPSLEQKVADNRAEIAKLEAEIKASDVAAALAKQNASLAQAAQLQRDADAEKARIQGKLKAAQLKQDQLAAEEKRRSDAEAERLRLLAAKSEDDKRLAKLKAVAEERRRNNPTQQAGDFPTVESAVAEIKRLNERINAIETGYEKELEQTRKQVMQRYQSQLDVVDNKKHDEFETIDQFKAKQEKERTKLLIQSDAELGRLSASTLALAETTPLRDSIRSLSARKYVIGLDGLAAELGAYDADAQKFSISVQSKISVIQLMVNGSIPMGVAEARVFKQQWAAGGIRPEASIKPSGVSLLALANDVDKTYLIYADGAFMTKKARQKIEKEREKQEQIYRPAMVKIPSPQPFLLATTEVTQAQFREVVGKAPSRFKGCGENCPVEDITYNDVQIYLKRLNEIIGGGYRLPTEAEWEFACKAGKSHKHCGGDNSAEVGWYKENSEGRPHPVAQKRANAFGLYDMSGNVREIVQVCQNANCYEKFITRGGSWEFSEGEYQRCCGVDMSFGNNGFRVARTIPNQ